tara:strand:+ start:245 stop:889 length:645 start_codon:yes stop_codon:yes gene_type:complete
MTLNQFNVENKWYFFADEIRSVSGELTLANDLNINEDLSVNGHIDANDASFNNVDVSGNVTASSFIGPMTQAYGAFNLGSAYTIPSGTTGTYDIPFIARSDVTPVGMSVNAGIITLTNAGTYLIMSTVYFLGDNNTFIGTFVRDTANNNLFHMGIFGNPTVTNDDETDRLSSNGHYVLVATAGYQFKISAAVRFSSGSTYAHHFGTGLTVLQIT